MTALRLVVCGLGRGPKHRAFNRGKDPVLPNHQLRYCCHERRLRDPSTDRGGGRRNVNAAPSQASNMANNNDGNGTITATHPCGSAIGYGIRVGDEESQQGMHRGCRP